ncbi:MAG: hypothetical protein K6B65_01525 [Bacilli bacterium]|nr:hypothetical protein [Bacilli bacterium]
MDRFYVNIIHRPELSPEYAEKVTQQGKKNDISSAELIGESLDVFKTQQRLAHENGLKTTIQMTYASMFNDEAIEEAKKDHEKYGDEIGLSLLGLPCKQFREKYKTKDFCIWMFSKEDKKSIVDDVFSLFKEKFGFYPHSTSSYFLDAFTINYIKEKYPSVVTAVAACWEEGPKAYHTCNNSWYTFLDGGPWAPWIPSKKNSHCPASSKEDDSGIVAIPHLSRDLLACYDGNGSNFGTHPQNVVRGMIYDEDGELPYLYNLIDQYRHLGKYNNGFSYNMMFVGPGWMNKAGRWEAPYSLLYKSYDDAMKYYGELKKEGKLIDLTMEELSTIYREAHPDYQTPERALWKDILYGSNKEIFWYADPYLRACLDFNQGGAMIDLRPYVARLDYPVGIGTDHPYDASYPYLIQANYRAGYFTHYAGAGTLKSARISYGKEVVDLALERTMAKIEVSEKGDTVVKIDPVTLSYSDGEVKLASTITFEKGTGKVYFRREILENPSNLELNVEEYFVGGFGTTEYQADMRGIKMSVENDMEKKVIPFEYRCREIRLDKALCVKATIPQVSTVVEIGGENDYGEFEEGHAFSPSYRLSLFKKLRKGVSETWLNLKKAD